MTLPTYPDARELLLESVPAEAIRHRLVTLGFHDWESAHRRILRLAAPVEGERGFSGLLPHMLGMVSETGDPDGVLVNLERFLAATASRREAIRSLAGNLRATEMLVKLFSGSQFLTEILLRNPEYFDVLIRLRELVKMRTPAEFGAALPPLPTRPDDVAYGDALRRAQRWELLRIGTCDLLGLYDLPAVTAQLSNLADALVQAGLSHAQHRSGEGSAPQGFVVLAMGKLGGGELNYSSDIDLLFLCREDAGSYRRVGEHLISILSKVTDEGFLYRVDMRLRPWGRSGPLVTSTSAYLSYLDRHARVWEKQALLKARPVAGNLALGARVLTEAAPIIYDIGGDAARRSVMAMRSRTERNLHRQGIAWGEVKQGEGSIRDVEFVAQALQLAHGADQPDARSPNTLDALRRLSAAGTIAASNARVLADGYVFLRTIEHYLQMMHYRQTHVLPQDTQALAQLAKRLGFQGEDAGALFTARYEEHRAAIRAVYLQCMGGGSMDPSRHALNIDELSRAHVAQMDVSYAGVFSQKEIARHAQLAASIDHTALALVEAEPLEEAHWRVTIVGYDYPGELSLICGLLFAYGFSIVQGHVFTYRPPEETARERRKIVDTFTVQALHADVNEATWRSYADDLRDLLTLMQDGKAQEAQGRLVKRVAAMIPSDTEAGTALYPVEIEIDNEASEDYTVLHIDAPDTVGFLYELTNALAYSRVYIARVSVESYEGRVYDSLFVTDAGGRKIEAPGKLRELRAAVVLIKHFTHLLPQTPDPETALLHFREFIGQLFRQSTWPDELASLQSPEVLDRLAKLLGVSEFLWDDFLRMQHSNLFPVVRDVDALRTKKSRDQLQTELEEALARVHTGPQLPSASETWRKTLNAFKDREMFRIDMRHILGHTSEFWDFSEELTALAEVTVNAAFHLCHEDMRTQYGTPYREDGGISQMAVCALGKCGGRELGFASDIELMFVYDTNGTTTGPTVTTTAEFYERLVGMFLQVIQAKREGIFEIDLRLRPYGKSGSMAVSMASFQRYFAPEGPAWAYERQALVKLRQIAGDDGLGKEIVALRDAYIYRDGAFDVTAMRAMRERQVRHLVTGGTFNAKYSPGGLVDVEYLVQALQIRHGNENPALRQPNIRAAMLALAEAGLLSEGDYTQLRKAHTFLRWLIDALRMVRGNAKDLTVPAADDEAFAFLARRLRYGEDTARLHEELVDYTSAVQALNRQMLA